MTLLHNIHLFHQGIQITEHVHINYRLTDLFLLLSIKVNLVSLSYLLGCFNLYVWELCGTFLVEAAHLAVVEGFAAQGHV